MTEHDTNIQTLARIDRYLERLTLVTQDAYFIVSWTDITIEASARANYLNWSPIDYNIVVNMCAERSNRPKDV
jgi:hypothetical protein